MITATLVLERNKKHLISEQWGKIIETEAALYTFCVILLTTSQY